MCCSEKIKLKKKAWLKKKQNEKRDRGKSYAEKEREDRN